MDEIESVISKVLLMDSKYTSELLATIKNFDSVDKDLNDTSLLFILNEIVKTKKVEKEVKIIDPLMIRLLVREETAEVNFYKSKLEGNTKYKRNPLNNIGSYKDLEEYKLIVLPVHSGSLESVYPKKEGVICSRHWSVLVYFTNMNVIMHYDSLKGINNGPASYLVYLLSKHTEGFIKDDTRVYSPDFIPIQDNVWQCGYVVTMIISELINIKKLNFFKYLPLTKGQVKSNISSSQNCLNYIEKIRKYYRNKHVQIDTNFLGRGVETLVVGKRKLHDDTDSNEDKSVKKGKKRVYIIDD